MKITKIDAFQVQWTPNDKPSQRSAFVRVHTDDGVSGLGEASPMQGGLASLGMIKHNLAPRLIGADPLDHAVLLDTLFHDFVKLGPEGALTGSLIGAGVVTTHLMVEHPQTTLEPGSILLFSLTEPMNLTPATN